MSICNKERLCPGVWSIARLAFLLLACLDVRQVDVEAIAPFALDDFEDGDEVTANPELSNWDCYTWPGPRRVSCGPAAPGFESTGAWVLRFELENPLDGVVDYPQVTLRTTPQRGTIDLSDYAVFAFSAKLEVDSPNIPRAARLYLRLSCGGIAPSAANPNGAYIETSRELSPDWSSFSVALSELVRADYLANLTRAECLGHVNALELLLHPALEDGMALRGTLTVDGISIQ